METMNNNEEIEINFREIFAVITEKIAVIILVAIIGAASAFIYTKFFVAPTYKSAFQVYVKNNEQLNADSMGVQASDLSASLALTKDYRDIIKSTYVLEQVINELGLNISTGQLASKISVATPNDSRIITIYVTDTDPWKTKSIADAVAKTAKARVAEIIGTDTVKNIDEESKVGKQVGPNLKLNILIGFAAGMLLSIIFIVARFMLDDTIKVQEDVEKYLGLSVLGLIPDTDMGNGKKKKKKKKIR